MPEHSPGPWQARGIQVFAPPPPGRRCPHHGMLVGTAAMAWKGSNEAFGNARLFAASPDLLAACKALVQLGDFPATATAEMIDLKLSHLGGVIAQAREAIAKAEATADAR